MANVLGPSLYVPMSPASSLARRALTESRVPTLLICAPIVVTTILGKVSVPPFSAKGLGVGFPILIALFLIGLCVGKVSVNVGRAAYLGIMVGIFGAIHVIRQEPFSLTSIAFLLVANVLLVLQVPRINKGPEDAMRFVTNFAAVIGVLGIIQFLAQFVVGRTLAFPLESFLPRGFLISGFNYLNPLYFGSTILKSNGVFLLEPSFFSQLMAIGLIVELTLQKRFLRLAIFALAILFSYSGTGLIVLFATLPILLVLERRLDILLAILGIIVVVAIFATPLNLDVFLNRLGEFNNPRSSAYIRFVGWIYLAQDSLFSDLSRTLFGYGAGTFAEVASRYHDPVAETLHSKIIEEYGVLGFLAYIGFLLYCIFRSPFPFAIRLSVAVLQFMSGAFSEPVTGITLSLLLLSTTPQEQSDQKKSLRQMNGT